MKRLFSFFALAALAILLMAPVALAEDPKISVGERTMNDLGGRVADNGDVIYRCATDETKGQLNAPTRAQIDEWIAQGKVAAGGVIPVNFHVIYNGSEGNVPESQLDQQIVVLNRNYAGQDYNGNPVPGAKNTGYTFFKNSVTRTNSRKWFTMTPGSRSEQQAKTSLCVNQTSTLNLYTAKPGQNLLGWSTFPWDLNANGKMDGVVIHYGSLPGGYLSPYNLGGTATHEVGHWVGLYHTFQGGCDGGNCSGAGDLVCDTPGEATATSGCPTNKDTCPQAGLDPVHNYMDYSTDICYNQFTPGQDTRADAMMANYRPLIGSARVADPGADLPISDFKANEGHGPRNADNGDVVYRCASEDKGHNAPSKQQIDLWIAQNPDKIAAGGVIPVNFHVIYNGSEGNVPESQLDQQIVVLNRTYAGQDYNGNPVPGAKNTGYTFFKNSVTRTNSRKWFTMTPGSRSEQQAKTSLCVNQTSTLNLYTAKPGQNLLGWSTFPWDLNANGKMDGVVIHYGSLPGGYLSPYNLGGTATHEVGHWVGLYHTFQGGCDGGNCSGAGDLVCDTPGEATATSGCPTNKDTCPQAGLDPVHNYMDYSTDICYNQFTPGQDTRADAMMSSYRPLIGSAARTNPSATASARDLNGGLVEFKALPNPFNPRTKIEFGLAHEGRATVRIFDVNGRLVSTVVDRYLSAGNHSFDFDGAKMASGVYWMRLQVNGQASEVKRLSLLK